MQVFVLSLYMTSTVLYSACFLQHNDLNKGMDINVTGVWEHNITGRGVTVVVVDDGVEHTHKDIQPNYVSQTQLHFATGGQNVGTN